MTVQEKLNNTCKVLLENDRFEDLYILARYTYMTHPLIADDEQYDDLERALKELQPKRLIPYFARTYDDDPTPVELLQEFDLMELINEQLPPEEYVDVYNYMNAKKSLSIMAVTEADEVWDYIQSVRGKILRVSLKINGNNTKTLYRPCDTEDGKVKLMLSLSRGRAGNSFDLTKNMSRILNQDFLGNNEIMLYSETYVEEKYLSTLVEKYGEGYVTPKSAAVSLTRRDHGVEDYQHLKTLVFSAEGLPFKTGSEGLEFLRSQGFDVVPYMLIKPDDIPTEYEQFPKWLEDTLKEFEETKISIPSDGVVFDVDDVEFIEDINNQYSSRNIAVKMHAWRFKYYVGTVKSIIIEPTRVYSCCKVEIEPMFTEDNAQAKIIDTYNPRILIQQGLSVGSKVLFMRDSEAINKLVRLDSGASVEELEKKGLIEKGVIKTKEKEMAIKDLKLDSFVWDEIDDVIKTI